MLLDGCFKSAIGLPKSQDVFFEFRQIRLGRNVGV
jgi:hypothetical protein